jgi:hypothetical protein
MGRNQILRWGMEQKRRPQKTKALLEPPPAGGKAVISPKTDEWSAVFFKVGAEVISWENMSSLTSGGWLFQAGKGNLVGSLWPGRCNHRYYWLGRKDRPSARGRVTGKGALSTPNFSERGYICEFSLLTAALKAHGTGASTRWRPGL